MWTDARIKSIDVLSPDDAQVVVVLVDGAKEQPFDVRVRPEQLTREGVTAKLRQKLSGLQVSETAKTDLAPGTVIDLRASAPSPRSARDIWFDKYSIYRRLVDFQSGGLAINDNRLATLKDELVSTYDSAFVG